MGGCFNVQLAYAGENILHNHQHYVLYCQSLLNLYAFHTVCSVSCGNLAWSKPTAWSLICRTNWSVWESQVSCLHSNRVWPLLCGGQEAKGRCLACARDSWHTCHFEQAQQSQSIGKFTAPGQTCLAGCSSKANWQWIVRIRWRGKWDRRQWSSLDNGSAAPWLHIVRWLKGELFF